jgi:acetyl esterase
VTQIAARNRYDVKAEEIAYTRPEGRDLLARLYRPQGTGKEPLPALVEVHGGAWNYFDRHAGALYNRALASCGIVVLAIDFRMGPHHKHPAASADVATAVRFLRANAARLRVAPDRIALLGSSSGGHLALLAAIKPNAPEHLGTPVGGTADVDAAVCAVLALWPVSDPLYRYRYALSRRGERRDPEVRFNPEATIAAHLAYFGSEDAMANASIQRCLADGEAQSLPPAWVCQPGRDQNVPAVMTDELVRCYRAAGGAIELSVFPNQGHGFAHAPGPDTDECLERMRRFLSAL